MKPSDVARLSDSALRRDLITLAAENRRLTARLLAHLAEFDARRLYAGDGYSSTYAWCVGELRLSEESAYKRIRAARAAREFPAIFWAVAEGRLHLTAVVMLAAHLTHENAADLLAAAELKSKAEIERLLAERFPQPDLPSLVQPIAPPSPPARSNCQKLSPGTVQATQPVDVPHSRVQPLAPERFGIQFTIGAEDNALLQQAQDLLGCEVPPDDIGAVFTRALRVLVRQLEKRKFGATDRPRKPSVHESTNPRHIPAHVRRAVHERDGHRCTFVAESGRRCEATRHLELDHIEPVARGGKSTAANLRLRCRAHNQYAAEQLYGADFMQAKREEAKLEAEVPRRGASPGTLASAPMEIGMAP